MIAGAAMAMFAMVASITYQHHGFFTPLFHISALLGSPKSMMTSIGKAMAGTKFWFTAGPAVAGLLIHMLTGAAYGMAFSLLARRLPRRTLVPAGIAFGFAAFVVSSFVALPLAAAITGSGATISDMAKMVGWTTFAAEHMMFGFVLGLVALRLASTPNTTDARVDTRTAILSS